MDFRIKELCKERGILFKELAHKLGITDVGLRQSLQGNPTVGTLDKIAAALNVEIVDLFERRGDFVAFVRNQGRIYSFDTIKALKEFTDAAHEAAENMRQFGEAVEVAKNKEE